MKYSAAKGMQLIGFADVRSVPHYHLLVSVECVCAEPSNGNAATALSALIHALAGTSPSSFPNFPFPFLFAVFCVECMCAEPGDGNAATALSALIHALAGTSLPSFPKFSSPFLFAVPQT